jgi:hypothetical protein
MAGTDVVLEIGAKKVFASALDWPGWCRSGRTEEAALEALAEYAPRYAVVAKQAGVTFGKNVTRFTVVERVKGDATTDFGAPGAPAAAEAERVTPAAARRMAALVEAAWVVFDKAAATAPAELRKGPRGGGRDRDKMIGHVLGSEVGYASRLGVKLKEPGLGDTKAIKANRAAILEVLGAASDGEPLKPKGWTTRYAARRIAWHALDHVWEMQDRSEPA